MKRIFLLLAGMIILLFSCSKKTVPAATTATKAPERNNTTITRSEPPASITTPVKPPTVEPTAVAPTTAPAFSSPMIVIDEAGKVITSREQLPDDIAEKVDYKKIAHGFTPVQRQNLIGRFKMVPPKVLFVPAQLASKSAKGYYCVFKKKFWYWQKEDGLFYLDETYYQ